MGNCKWSWRRLPVQRGPTPWNCSVRANCVAWNVWHANNSWNARRPSCSKQRCTELAHRTNCEPGKRARNYWFQRSSSLADNIELEPKHSISWRPASKTLEAWKRSGPEGDDARECRDVANVIEERTEARRVVCESKK